MPDLLIFESSLSMVESTTSGDTFSEDTASVQQEAGWGCTIDVAVESMSVSRQMLLSE